MRGYNFKDFNQAYHEINKIVLLEPKNIVDFYTATLSYTKDLIVEVNSTKCDKIELGNLGYKPGKWKHLLDSYVGPELIERLKNIDCREGGLTPGIDFKRKKTGNGSCLREIILGKEKRKKEWTEATIIWRTTELQKRWACDLVLIHRLLELIPDSNFTKITLIMPYAYQSAMYVVPLVEPVFGIKLKDVKLDHPHGKEVHRCHQKYYLIDSPRQKLSVHWKLQDLQKLYLTGQKPPEFNYKHCLLEGVY